MIKNGKEACDWCGRVFRKKTPRYSYSEIKGGSYKPGTAYHIECAKKVGGKTDLGRK